MSVPASEAPRDRSPIVLVFHAERLHGDRVWRRVRSMATWMRRKDLSATFFVYPFRAQRSGRAIEDRVREIAGLGHEIGQHTHFYADTVTEGPLKRDDLSEQNVTACLRRDFAALCRIGCRPRGFTAGAWLVNEAAYHSLVDLGFVYDCSSRLTSAPAALAHAHGDWLLEPRFRKTRNGRLLCLPSSCSLGQWFRWARKVRTGGPVPYQLVYVHDYDLLRPQIVLLAWLFLFLNGRRWMALDELTEQLIGSCAA